MRKTLRKIENKRCRFTAKVERFGSKKGWGGRELKTILLTEIRNEEGELVADHLWINRTKTYNKANVMLGDRIGFDGRVKEYTKGYQGHREDVFKPVSLDYKISHLTNFNVEPLRQTA